MPLEPGTTLGPYAVTAKIGEGGMGEVYRARDTKLDRDVALKVLPEAFTQDPDRLARFEREAKVLASLNHPNIGHIYGLEESEGIRALVLELVEGPTLADRIKQGPIPLDEALPIAKQIAEALEAAHEAGVIHRDLKPANVKVKDDGTVKVLDFGLAKALDPHPTGDPSQSPTLTAAATQMGVIMGTAAYMSPEQARGKTVDKRADIWAFGCVLFEMLTGRKAFEGEDVSLTLASVMKSDLNVTTLPHDVPATVRTVLRQCLVKDPRERLRDIGDVRLAMEGAFETTVSAATEPMGAGSLPLWQRPASIVLAVVASLAVGGVAVWVLTRPAPLGVTRFPIPLATDQTFSSTDHLFVAISPDGTKVVYSANGSLWLRSVDQLDATQVAGTDQAEGPFFSADGQSIGFWANGQLKKVSVRGGAPVTLADVPLSPAGASWGVDDMILYVQQREGIMQVAGASGTPTLLIPTEQTERIYQPQMLPGGEWVLFSVHPFDDVFWDEGQIVAQSVTTNERTVLIEGRGGRYLSTGHLVYDVNTVLFAVPFDVGSRQVTGGPVPLVQGVREAAGTRTGAMQFRVSANGSLVYVPASAGDGNVTTLVWVSRDGDEEAIPAPPGAYGHPQVSPDGTRVAVDITDGANTDVWIWDLARETPAQLTFGEGFDGLPLWTPDGSRVVFGSARESARGGLFWRAADGTGQVERLKDEGVSSYTWAADGRLVFQDLGGNIGVLTMEGDRTEEMLLAGDSSEADPALSPDGRWLAYASNETGTPLIYVRPFPNVDDGQRRVSPGYGRDPTWSPDGSELFYRTRTDLMVTQVETDPTFTATTPERLFSLNSYVLEDTGGEQFGLAPDGNRFIFVKSDAASQASNDASFNGLIFIQNWFEELTRLVPVP